MPSMTTPETLTVQGISWKVKKSLAAVQPAVRKAAQRKDSKNPMFLLSISLTLMSRPEKVQDDLYRIECLKRNLHETGIPVTH